MKKIKLDLTKRSYEIIIGRGVTDFIGSYAGKLKIGKDAYILTNKFLKDKYGARLSKSLENSGIKAEFKTVADSEKSKSISTASSVISDLARKDKKKRIFIVAFGGGVIGDLAGFVASVYKRGTPYIQVPTTLLAQVDSAIGGKTAVDLSQGKNLVGAFYQPRAVFSDLKFLDSLNARQLRSGLAEVIKYGIIKDAELFRYLEKNYTGCLCREAKVLEKIVSRSSLIKARIVEQDEREEKGLRTVLNFGHTLGHAIETAAGYEKYNHGEAVALGMLIAADTSLALGYVDKKTVLRIEGLIKAVGLPVVIKKLKLDKIMDSFYHDKKFIGSKNRLVLITGIGKTKIVENVRVGLIKEVLKKRLV